MKLNRDAVLAWTKRAETEELLDRATVLRREQEPAALDLIERELTERGLTASAIDDYGSRLASIVLRRSDGSASRCQRCGAPAVVRKRCWWKIFGLLPVFPIERPACQKHA